MSGQKKLGGHERERWGEGVFRGGLGVHADPGRGSIRRVSASAVSGSPFVSSNEPVPLHMTSLLSKYVVTHTHTHTHTHVHTHTHAQSEVGCTQGYS